MGKTATKKAAAKVERLKVFRSPKGIAAFPRLREPDDYDKMGLVVAFADHKTDAEFKAFVKEVTKLHNEALKTKHKVSDVFKVVDEDLAEKLGLPVGTPYLRVSTIPKKGKDGDYIPVPVYNAEAVKDDGLYVNGTDLVRVECTLATWESGFGKGVKFYLSAVQVLESNGGSGAGRTFEVEDDFVDADRPEDEVNEDGLEDEGESGFEDEDASFEAEDEI